MPGVLVTDGMQRKSLAAVRALGTSGIRVVAAEWTPFAAALFSRYASRAWMPKPSQGEEEVARALGLLCWYRKLDVLLPMEERTLLAVMKHKELLPPGVAVPFPDLPVLSKAMDKGRILSLARALGVPIPRTHFPDDEEDLADDFPLPALVKPRTSSGAVGIRYAETREQLLAAFDEVDLAFPGPLIQERLPREGEGVGVSILMGEGGEVHALFTHRRLREFPVSGGASTLRESAREPDAEESAVQILRALRWRGVAMVEFKRDLRDETCKLMEVNGRFWGSLALAVKAGVNFPLLLVKLARGEKLGPPPEYPLGVRSRWLLPGDILHYLSNPDRHGLAPPFFRFREKNLHYDIADPEDPWPVLGTALSVVPFLLDPDLRRFIRR
ncbi:MAG: carboxylate--amine ligase [Planctomycetota bacterium]|jgi:predicted ATP-grasp superfamily ATP-dependent carboligase